MGFLGRLIALVRNSIFCGHWTYTEALSLAFSEGQCQQQVER